jgi:hypothetical protein
VTVSPAGSAGIFISYRREDAAYPAGWLYDRLVAHFGERRIFKDVDSIRLGDDFVEEINTAVGSCAALLAVIGNRWLTVTGEDGQRRLDDPSDFVRLEIEAALQRGVRVIPVLVDQARMPTAAELPASLAQLTRRQALDLSHNRFKSDTSHLLEVLDTVVDRAAAPSAEVARPSGSDSAPAGKPPRTGARPDASPRPDLPVPLPYQADPDLPTGGSKRATSYYPDVPVAVWSDPDPGRRALMLTRIGLDLAETDRGQSRRVFAAAERAAHEVADSYPRFHLLVEAARQARRSAPGQARRFLGLAAACAADLADQPLFQQRALETLKELHALLRD